MTLQQKVERFANANGWQPELVMKFAKESGEKSERMLSPNDVDNLYLTDDDIIILRELHAQKSS